jgi:hypothetical protein
MLSPRNKNLWIHSLWKTWKNKDVINNNKNYQYMSLNLINLFVIKENVLKDTCRLPILWMNEWEFDDKSLLTHPQLLWWTQLWVQRVKTTKGQGVGAHSLPRNTLGVQGRVGAPGWILGIMTSKLITHMDLQKPNNKLINA